MLNPTEHGFDFDQAIYLIDVIEPMIRRIEALELELTAKRIVEDDVLREIIEPGGMLHTERSATAREVRDFSRAWRRLVADMSAKIGTSERASAEATLKRLNIGFKTDRHRTIFYRPGEEPAKIV